MASPAQCLYCFECLAASYRRHEPINLENVEELWERYERSKKIGSLQDSNDLGPQVTVDEEEIDTPQHESSHSKDNRPNAIKLPSVSRLQSQPSSDPSSTATTPSAMSTSSSRSILSISTAVTTPSSTTTVSETAEGIQRRSSDQRYPLFVTWDTLSKNGRKSLRGCIGTFEAQELSDGLKSYALTSAFDDTRFSPIPESLLPSLSCSLTLLGSFEPCTNALDWSVGVHGIRISFIHRGRRYGATYLPDVAVEQGWTKEETLESLMRKAGWNGQTTGSVTRRLLRGSSSTSHSESGKPWEQVSDFRVVRYQGLKASASYAEWQDWRQWVLSLEDGSEELLHSTSR
ncbi:AMMECR1 domain-containing protein [Aspergillus clavatus NRRL 1]|uniref:AMMECR1 family protein n=1 Tax=Aspergillus clavatus (strain ATCC 1007 / CBS 513.65 / DSM 816 / NCTC 3887 / NRRL 1 / QM 1276 / 107) TaxID=344612 RepID=A1CK50_ASPCL|nr:AMMECR1 family protein [Aspergillus clavatus NRRL 1]EAW09524.1 AMMECR1 family protein [Aspergillus clavatus NRRL 1]